MITTAKPRSEKSFTLRMLVFTALLGAMSAALSEFLKFPLPIMPSFIKFDFSDVPALMASLTMGPLSGAAVVLIKNLLGLFTTSTGGVGELSNFLLGCALVLPAGFFARNNKSGKGVLLICLASAAVMALASIATNYFIVYPIYDATVFPMAAIINAYQKILPSVDSLIECLLIFNLPFTFVKGLVSVLICVPLYKRLRPIFNNSLREQQ